MFDFLFKRSGKAPAAERAADQAPEPAHRADAIPAKQAALAQAEILANDESAAADFILHCEFADARLRAAHHIHSKPVLECVAQAMRNADRRVARLMQQRLEEIARREVDVQKANRCVKEAQRLAEEPQLMLNQVADLDRAWQSVGDIPAPLHSQFDNSRSMLNERLEAQTALQRAAIDVSARLQQLMQMAADAQRLVPPAQIAQTLDSLEQEMTQYCAAREAPSLPKHLLHEFIRQLRGFREKLASMEKRYAAILAYEEAFASWEAASSGALSEDALKRAWRTLPELDDSELHLFKDRFDALLERIGKTRKPTDAAINGARPDSQRHITEILEGLEKALADGALQVASEHDKTLRAIDLKSIRLSDRQTARLAKARSELSHLQSWARWGGNVSREELLKAAEELSAQALAIPELTKKIGSLRERWKSLDASAGPAGRELWGRFDAACTTAYAPAAEHFRKLADERRSNLVKAQSIIAEVREFALASHCAGNDASNDPSAVDWKAVADFCARTTQSWQRLGPIDRKEKKSADIELAAAMHALTGPLAAQQEIEKTRREKLIAEVTGLSATDRGAVDTLRNLQERWQERVKSLPLAHREERALWQRFRSACDAVFARRREVTQAADAERQQHLLTKQALCAALEVAADASDDAVLKALRETREAWEKTGPVPRAAEREIDIRYQSAVKALQTRLDQSKRSALSAQFDALRDKLAQCHTVERMVAHGARPDDNELTRLQRNWQSAPAALPEFERALAARFNAAITALGTSDRQYASVLERNATALAQQVLRLEVLTGTDSPAELSRERLQLQVEVLQSSLKAGQKAMAPDAQLIQLFGLPALTDRQTGDRLDRLIARFQGSKS